MAEFSIIAYSPELKGEWNRFLAASKNGTFLFDRDYMDYHSDRFRDASLMVARDGKPYALFPANVSGDTVTSHGGLTYGGLVTGRKATVAEVLDVFGSVCRHYAAEGMRTLVYKPVPHIYHSIPSEEDLYALFRLGASLRNRLVSSAILMSDRIRFRDIRKAGIRKAVKAGVVVGETRDLAPFWDVLETNLHDKYGAHAVHSLAEITLLASRFPDNIRLFTTKLGGETVGGTLLFINRDVVHTQYISASPAGKECGALDLLFGTLIEDVFSDCRYFDFGTSNEEGGRVLNEALIYQKEGFGGRAVCYDTYEVKIGG